MAEQISRLQHVYDKWSRKEPIQSPTMSDSVANDLRTRRVIEEGRQKWRAKYGAAPKPVMQRRAWKAPHNVSSMQSTESLASFKSSPTITADDYRVRRPYLNPACKCIEFTRNELDKPHFSDLGVCDILNVNRHLRKASRLSWCCSHLSYITHGRKYFSYSDVSQQVLGCDRLQKAVIEKANSSTSSDGDKAQLSKVIAKFTQVASSSLAHMKARMSNFIMILSGWALMKFFTRLLTRIQVHSGHMALVKAAAEREIPLVYLPTHRSHLDYILLTVILWLYNVRVPHIAAGENLNLPIFSYFMRRQGAFFIRRKLDRHHGQRDTVYRALLHSYMEEVLKAGESLEFFIEGGRSRTGKPSQPKAGLLSVVVEACRQGIVDDVYIVPVSINYERTLEGSFVHEQMGVSKKSETFVGVVKGLWGLFTSRYGAVRVDFSQPFSLKEYINSCEDTQSNLSCSDCDSPVSSQSGVAAEMSRKDSFYTGEFLEDNHRSFINNIACHIVYNTTKSTSLMCTNLVAFLLLTKHRQGTSLRRLDESFTSLVYQITAIHKQNVSFTGESRDVVAYACKLLGQDVVQIRYDPAHKTHRVTPNLTSLPAVFHLVYYSNAVVPLFILESVVGSCVLSLSGLSVAVIQSLSLTQSQTINKQALIAAAMELCQLLKEEFIFVPPCMCLETALYKTIDELISYELLTVHVPKVFGGTSHEENMWARRFEKRHRWRVDENDESEEEEDSQLILLNISRPDLTSRLFSYRDIVAPYAEAFCLVIDHLLDLDTEEIPEDTFMSQLHSDALSRCERGTALYVEHAAMETLRNCTRTLESRHYAHSYLAGALRMIGRYDSHDSEQRLRRLRDFLSPLFN